MAISLDDVVKLRDLLGDETTREAGGVNRGGFYLYYYKLVMDDAIDARSKGDSGRVSVDVATAHQIMLQAEISTYSGFAGGAALIGNALAKSANPQIYTDTLDAFSWKIANNLFLEICRMGQARFS